LERMYRDDPGHAVMLLGGEPCLDPGDWPARIDAHASLRRQLHRAANKGVVIEEWDPDRARDHPQLRACLKDWLATRGLPPLHFLIETETLLRVYDRRIFVAVRDGGVIAFLVASPIPARNGWLVEQLVRGHAAVNGTSELLIDAALRAVASTGSTYVSLGLAPLSNRVVTPGHDNPRWLRYVLRWLRTHGTRSYNFVGLEAFKAKFRPDRWDPVYAVVDRSAIYPSTLYAIGSAFAQGSPVPLLGRALWKTVRRKLHASADQVRRVGGPAGVDEERAGKERTG
ncbi:MAG: phosphatidylglycerol lysyltransferase domain-containing protein, partial [Rhodothermales bacterium]